MVEVEDKILEALRESGWRMMMPMNLNWIESRSKSSITRNYFRT